jgi:type IV pilus assembly protein PilQ
LGWGYPLDNLANLQFTEGGLKFGFLDGSLGAFVDALETIGDTNVIATPRLLVLNKHRADILIGKEEGYVSTTQTETARTQSVEFLDIGAQLRLRPFISCDGLIRMEVHPELSDGNVRELAGFTVPRKDVTKVTTNIMVRDGCTVIIGGLMREQLETTTQQIPFFGSLPLVGPLFRNVDEKVVREEVLVLITPRIVYEPETCMEGQKAADEFLRRQAVYADSMSIAGTRSIGRRYLRLAEHAWQTGQVALARRFADLAVHFDPLNRAAIELRSQVWMTEPDGVPVIQQPLQPVPNESGPAQLTPQVPAPQSTRKSPDPVWDRLFVPGPSATPPPMKESPPLLPVPGSPPDAPLPPDRPLHPRDSGMPGTHRDLVRPTRPS